MNKKKILFFILLIILLCFSLYAQESTLSEPETALQSNFKTFIGTIITVIGSIYIKILAIASLVMIGIRLILSNNRQKFLKEMYGWIIACILVTLTPSIVNKVFKIADSIKNLQTFSLIDTPSFTNKK